MDSATYKRLSELDGYVILIRQPGSNSYSGYVEHSFSMSYDANYTVFFIHGGRWNADGFKEATHHAEDIAKTHPDWTVEVWNVRDETLPVILDWEKWILANEYNPNTLSGVSDKFKARNFEFSMKD